MREDKKPERKGNGAAKAFVACEQGFFGLEG